MSHSDESPRLHPGKLPGPLLRRLIDTYRTQPDPAVTVPAGYGRDAAAIDVSGEQSIIVKSDPITFASAHAAHYLVSVNANDIACMGGDPRWLTVVALLPAESTSESQVEALFHELQQACDSLRVSLIGGHTEVTMGVTQPILVGTMLGTVGPGGVLEPGKARPGDRLYLTKAAGLEGTALLAIELRDQLIGHIEASVLDTAARFLHDPGISVVADAKALRTHPAVRAMHDPTEGGVATAIHELAEVAGLGAEVYGDEIPILAETRSIAHFLNVSPLGMLSSGALLLAVDDDLSEDFEHHAQQSHVPVTCIGRLVESGLTLQTAGIDVPLPRFDRDEVSRVL